MEHRIADVQYRICTSQRCITQSSRRSVASVGENIEKNPKKCPDWKVVNGLLHAHRPNKTVDPLLPDMDAWKLVLPEADRQKALAECHNTPQSGHLGVDKTFARVATYYYWPGYYRDVCWYVAACQVGQAHKSSNKLKQG